MSKSEEAKVAKEVPPTFGKSETKAHQSKKGKKSSQS
jgi:hypothetical protein